MGSMIVGGSTFEIPQELYLEESLDDKAGTYRIVLGKVDPTPIEQELYKPLFVAIEKYKSGLFIDHIAFIQDTTRLEMILAVVDTYTKPYGTFYEIESAVNDTKIVKDVVKVERRAKRKAPNSQRKAPRKGNTGISGT